jgi:hypothetical protein
MEIAQKAIRGLDLDGVTVRLDNNKVTPDTVVPYPGCDAVDDVAVPCVVVTPKKVEGGC